MLPILTNSPTKARKKAELGKKATLSMIMRSGPASEVVLLSKMKAKYFSYLWNLRSTQSNKIIFLRTLLK